MCTVVFFEFVPDLYMHDILNVFAVKSTFFKLFMFFFYFVRVFNFATTCLFLFFFVNFFFLLFYLVCVAICNFVTRFFVTQSVGCLTVCVHEHFVFVHVRNHII